ncbi:nuclear transport factor 2 family protein [Flavobacterium sp. SLB02]|jgi:ketosteroid isomerase-like protein|uniref:nuclear transport factor 2 family protein n=1 Tax=Flavobacterium sp. SLB02 TaxID=2665645 RepID=UPI0012A9277B|nr:nuclear transport factor 2 family protein [Flavobacterium sp. SLB02]QGK75205.1 nuclear transport factor 2 family protein [Flavobacterium sp. SLB02]
MTLNKQTVNEYMDAFRVSDHQRILACLTEDVIWEMPGIYQHVGKEAFDKEIENDNFVGSPTIQIIKLIEQNNIVIAEGAVQGNMKNGNILDAVFCDVFEMETGKIKKLTSYLMSRNASLKFE